MHIIVNKFHIGDTVVTPDYFRGFVTEVSYTRRLRTKFGLTATSHNTYVTYYTLDRPFDTNDPLFNKATIDERLLNSCRMILLEKKIHRLDKKIVLESGRYTINPCQEIIL